MSSPPAPEQKSLVGYTIGKCKLLRICGRGAMGTVYKGMHSGLDIEVAVKILPPHLANNSNLVERFMREAKLAARPLHDEHHWDLRIVVAETAKGPKKVGSTVGMERSRRTSPYYEAWVAAAPKLSRRSGR